MKNRLYNTLSSMDNYNIITQQEIMVERLRLKHDKEWCTRKLRYKKLRHHERRVHYNKPFLSEVNDYSNQAERCHLFNTVLYYRVG